jgi:excisionase family DNA binding protein
MISFNSTYISQQSHTGILINQHVTVQAAADVTGYNIQYLRRMLRSGVLIGIKIGQMWLIEMDALEAYLKRVESTSDRRCGPR